MKREGARWKRGIVARAACGVLALLAACSRDVPTPAWHDEAGYRWRQLLVTGSAPGFTPMTANKTGVKFQNEASEQILLGNRMLGQGAGVSLGDVDGDGRPDLFLARTDGCSALYHNDGGWTFTEITKRAGVGMCNRRATGSAFADVDGDGDLDLIVLSTTGANALFINDGTGRFVERRDAGMDSAGHGATTVTMADVNGSGTLAMFIANYKPYSVDDTIPPQQRAFNQMVREVAPKQYEITPEHRRDYKLVNRPDVGGLRMTQRAEPDEFYENDGAGHFSRVPMASSRFRDASGAPLKDEFESFGFAAQFADLNGDGIPDLYVANDFEDLDQLWLNDGFGNFRLGDWTTQREMSNSAMGLAIGDVNGDGLPDLFTTDMMANDPRRAKTQIPTHTALPKHPGDKALQLQQQRNSLFLNRGDGTFTEIAEAAGVSASGWSWGTTMLDVDLDGRQDILIANGHLWDIMDADVQEGLQNRLNDVPWQKVRWQFPALKLKNVAFRNRGDLTFEDASSAWHFGVDEDISHALATADIDGDGDLDVVVNRLGAPALLLRNDAPAPRVSVQLVGDAPNTRAVGARVTLYNGAVPMQTHEVVVGGLYLSHSDYTISFAMGASDSARVVVDWRDGRQTTIARVHANRAYEISQKNAAPHAAAVAQATAPDSALFIDATAQLGGHRHVENIFDDWDRQYLLPNALSQLGPSVSWYDIDRDGAEDLIVGTGKGGRISVFRNVGGRLVPQTPTGPIADNDVTAVLGMSDRGVTRLLAGVATWELRTDSAMRAQPAALSLATTNGRIAPLAVAAVGSHEASTGPMALGDVDGDGALDLFVGSRAMPQRYPLSVSSGLFRNVNGTFVLDTANLAVLHDIGMVTSAMFVDFNGDSHADLVLTRDWGSIVLLLNDGHGRLQPAPSSWGLESWTGEWNGVAAGDLDGDGRMDLIATNWGRNTGLRADSTHPLSLTFGAFGAGGETEMLLGTFDTRVHGMSPLNSYARIRLSVKDVVNRVRNFSAFADASVETVLGPAMNSARRIEARTLDHMLFLNRGDHVEATAIAAEAQWAPAFAVGVADFDGDGNEDVLLGQNFFPTMVGMPRHDAGRSLLLLGDGKGGLAPMSAALSGLLVFGDQRGAAYADFNGDGRLVVAISQNGDSTRLYVNARAKVGVRVRVKGPPGNPDGVGTQLRLVYGTRMGPVREVQTSAGYLSQNGAVQLFGESRVPTAVWVRWPGGATSTVPITAGTRNVLVSR